MWLATRINRVYAEITYYIFLIMWDKHELWRAALTKIQVDLSHPNFVMWFQHTGISHIQEGIVSVSVPNLFAKEWLQNKYHKTILHALRILTPEIRDITYIINKIQTDDALPKTNRAFSRFKHLPPAMDEALPLKELAVNPLTNLNPRYTFDTFVVGSFNDLAHAAAQSVIKSPGTGYNPFFVYGGVGLGKTHLIQAVGNAVLENRPHAKIRYIPSERYMGEIVDALKNQDMNRLKEKYREVDVLIMDDVQFIARTEKMQEEFFHTFNALYERNKQIIISSDRPPQAIATLAERLRSRFEGGMIADIGQPDYETRLLILKTKVMGKEIVIPEKVLAYIAESIKTNIRELEGGLNKVMMASRMSKSPLDVETAQKTLLHHFAAPKKFISAKKIMKAVADFYEIEEKDLLKHSRKRDVVRPRQIAMYIMRDTLKSSFPSIGEKFGGRDHTTAIHSCEKVAKDLLINPALEEELRVIKDRIFSEKA
ncbi:MAG: chromosomal replication initiator protein DnaA [Parcubacteria group bacterium Gr01-1014_66]|nr:MAG: chromosomal replication initiator protein DnaA [Parcubacteria group bacterium Gr01-1014_66]